MLQIIPSLGDDVQNVFRFFPRRRQDKLDQNTFSSSFLQLTLVSSPFKQYLKHTSEFNDTKLTACIYSQLPPCGHLAITDTPPITDTSLLRTPPYYGHPPITDTPLLRTPRYYGHPPITDSSKIPGESYRRWTEINSRYLKGLSLLRT